MATNKIAEFLNIILIENKIMLINFWSFVHMGSGIILALLKLKPFLATSLIILYEIVEFILARTTPLFRVEPTIDIIWDLILTIGAYFITYKILG